ncbi:MAG: fibronectin type III domain-containing protein [Candidatus Acidiferrales bacterium]
MLAASAAYRRRALRVPGGILLAACVCCLLGGCGAPGEPTPPKPIVPKPVTDLSAHQMGGNVVLNFTLPTQSEGGDRLAEPPAIEIFRGERPAGGVAKLTTRLVYTLPSAVVDTYLHAGVIEFRDPLVATFPAAQEMVYMVRVRSSKKRASADSNVVSVRVLPVPAPPSGVHAETTESAIELAWSAPAEGASAGTVVGYRVYRATIPAGVALPPEFTDVSQLHLTGGLDLIGPAPSTRFRDTQFAFDATYVYVVRSVGGSEGQSVESGDSRPIVVTPKDIFPPAAPQRLIVLIVPATQTVPANVELSWDISTEPDLAGYWVYRSEQPDNPGLRLNSQLLLSPTFRDMTALSGKRYYYRVSAVDRSGNESPLSSSVTADLPRQEP